ncbi:SspB family protein [Dongia sp.]|uniref:SspB family protein n=1 Tax=Dongia sp. TaxID=1977262 RepID=UPI0035B3323A
MAKDWLRYDQMVEDALRGVVRRALTEAAVSGLPGDHHFYITFRTDHPLVRIPQHLKAQYPREMTIVLQHQFWGLEVTDDSFTVTLSFGGKHEPLFIPYETIVSFADPSVKFALQFDSGEGDEEEEIEGEETGETVLALEKPEAKPALADQRQPASGDADPEKQGGAPTGGTVVALDAFRKKQQ